MTNTQTLILSTLAARNASTVELASICQLTTSAIRMAVASLLELGLMHRYADVVCGYRRLGTVYAIGAAPDGWVPQVVQEQPGWNKKPAAGIPLPGGKERFSSVWAMARGEWV